MAEQQPGADSEERILDAAFRVFSALGFRGSTTKRIADEAGVNEVTLFRRFPTKEALLTAALRRHAERTIAVLEQYALPQQPRDARAELTAYLDVIFPPMLATQQAHRTSIGEWGHVPALDGQLLRTTEYVYDEMQRYLERARAAGLLAGDIDPLIATQGLLGMLLADVLMRDQMPQRFPRPAEETAAAYVDLFLRGAGSSDRR